MGYLGLVINAKHKVSILVQRKRQELASCMYFTGKWKAK